MDMIGAIFTLRHNPFQAKPFSLLQKMYSGSFKMFTDQDTVAFGDDFF